MGLKRARIGKKRAKRHIKTTEGRVWTLKKADSVCSLRIRERDGRCLFPGCTVTDIKKLQCSHFFGRAKKSTRFYDDNLISLCWIHHYKSKILGFEYQKQMLEIHGWDGQYTLFMKNHLGTERYAKLLERANTSMKQNAAIKAFQSSL